LNIKLTSLRAEKTRNEEAVSNYKEHKEFLDRIAPKEWLEERIRRRNEKLQEVKHSWVEKQIEKLSDMDDSES